MAENISTWSMETDASPPPPSSLRHRLRATVCCCFGGDRAQWGRRRVGGELRYDPLSYALNFDEGAIDGEYEASFDDFGDGDGGGILVYRGFSSSVGHPGAGGGRRGSSSVAVDR